jgi:flavin-dependent dehydrogenase
MPPAVDRFDSYYDAVIVGARCAGAGTALLLARHGLKVLAIDRAAAGDDTLSTLALMRGGVMQLHRWGVLDRVKQAGTPAVRRTLFQYDDAGVEVAIKPRDGVDALYAPRRTVLDALLAQEAAASGAHVMHGVRLRELLWSAGRVDGVVVDDGSGRTRSIRARLVIGADGQRSSVARLAGARAYQVGAHGGAVVYALWPRPGLDAYHWRYRPRISVGMIPTNDGLACVFVAVPPERFAAELRGNFDVGYRRLLREGAPDLGAALEACAPASRYWGFGGVPGYFRECVGAGWALVGDAGYFKDPITAHGITDALRDAELLARAVVAGTPTAMAEYQDARDELSRGVFEISDRIASFAWDLDELKELHQALSQEMQREVAWMRGLEPLAAAPLGTGAA